MEDLQVGSVVTFKNIDRIENQPLSLVTYPFYDGSISIRERQSVVFNAGGFLIRAGVHATKSIVAKDIKKHFIFGGSISQEGFKDIFFCSPNDTTIGSIRFRFFDDPNDVLLKIVDIVGRELDVSKFVYNDVVKHCLKSFGGRDKVVSFFNNNVSSIYNAMWKAVTDKNQNPREVRCDCGKKIFDNHLTPNIVNQDRIDGIKKYLSETTFEVPTDSIFVYDKSLLCYECDTEYTAAYVSTKPNSPINVMMPIGWLNPSNTFADDAF